MCQNDQIFKEVFQISQKKKLDFWMTRFLDFWIFFGFLALAQERKELPEIRGCQNDRIFEGFSDFQKNCTLGFLNFCISVFFWISCLILGMKRATGDLLVSNDRIF